MPTTSTLSSDCMPSSFVSSWFTTLSWTTDAVAPPLPRAFMMASISSNMITCNLDFSALPFHSFSAGAKSSRMFSSDWPTNRCKISGPLTIFGGCALSSLPSCLATRVLPVPGGPYSSMPLTCRMPRRLTISGGTIREANTRRKMVRNSASRPPTPYRSKLPSASMSFRCDCDVSADSGGGSGMRLRLPAGPTRPSECIAMPSVGALTTVRLGWGFSVAGVDGVRATDPPRGAPNTGGAGFGLGGGEGDGC
mmetsp:Transcript_14774/g.62375  ORF Transcript_14774/g.62375 Transcript_14774/m.62375 type:complete len:251 (+) Transcript_14774:1353-2105(+)